MCAIFKKRINLFGNGLQVRDLLFIDDLLEIYELIITKAKYLKSTIFNVGGEIKNSMSILELIDFIRKEFKIKVKYRKKRDQVIKKFIFLIVLKLKNNLDGKSEQILCKDYIN